jgi:hypothetical protein
VEQPFSTPPVHPAALLHADTQKAFVGSVIADSSQQQPLPVLSQRGVHAPHTFDSTSPAQQVVDVCMKVACSHTPEPSPEPQHWSVPGTSMAPQSDSRSMALVPLRARYYYRR